tara:strand:- start:1028 stop:1924 length:897 start_codon:yes stop_codon:yes gene_type:complete
MDKNSLKFITEIASTHNGNFKILEQIFKKHIKSKSDLIKIQIINAQNIYPKTSQKYLRFKTLEIQKKILKKIIEKYMKKTRIILEIFDEDSFNFAKKFKENVYLKVSCSEADNLQIINDSIKCFKKIFINFSGFELNEIRFILNKIKNKKKIIILYGFQGYPSKINNLRFKLFDFFKSQDLVYGYADHSLYNNFFELCYSTLIAIRKGCRYIEKHVCLDQNKKPPDYISALEFDKFNQYITSTKEIYNKRLNNTFNMSKDEKTYKKNMRKFLFINKLGEKKFLRTEKISKKTRLNYYK